MVLSGTGTDGTLGLRAIKAEGGITFAQDKQSAVFGGMPHSAIASGNVDFVLPPEGIARELARIAADPYVVEPEEPETEETSPEGALGAAEAPALGMLFAALRRPQGVDFSHYKRTTILRRIRRRMLVHQMDKLTDFHNYLKNHPAEVEALYQDLLINVTEFFRDPEVFESLTSQVFPKIIKDRPPMMPSGSGPQAVPRAKKRIRWPSPCSNSWAKKPSIRASSFLGPIFPKAPSSRPARAFTRKVSWLRFHRSACGGFSPEWKVDTESARRFGRCVCLRVTTSLPTRRFPTWT